MPQLHHALPRLAPGAIRLLYLPQALPYASKQDLRIKLLGQESPDYCLHSCQEYRMSWIMEMLEEDIGTACPNIIYREDPEGLPRLHSPEQLHCYA